MIPITWVGMTRQHFERGSTNRIRMLVVHSTAGRHPSDLAWLRKGGDERRPVSVHYYIDKAGNTSQLVRDDDIAWHAGRSRWTIDGRTTDNLNTVSLGIELENLNTGRDPYPAAQYAAAVALSRQLVERYSIPATQLVRHLDISPGRKTDPAGFPWARFVAEVYAEQATGTPEEQLRAHMLDLAYRAAGAALPAAWPLLEQARQRNLGMPIGALNAHGRTASRSPGEAQDDRDRAIRLANGTRVLADRYARDLLFAPTGGPDDEPPSQATRLADVPAGPLRDELLALLFRSADPVNGYQPGWAFHRQYLAQAPALGVPIGPNHRIELGPRQSFACQHFALDSLCSPAGSWQTVFRLGELTRSTAGLDLPTAIALRRALQDDLYRARTGRRYDPNALLIRRAEERGLGAPLGRPEVVLVNGTSYLIMPFALDVLACPLPTADWPPERLLPAATPILALSQLEGSATPAAGGAHPAHLLATPTADDGVYPALGEPAEQPSVLDLSRHAPARRARTVAAPDLVLVATAQGPSLADLSQEQAAARWHYYLDEAGCIYRLRDESYTASEAEGELAERAVVIAVEGGPAHANPDQRRALAWLVRTLAAALTLRPDQIRAIGQRRAFPAAGAPV